MKMKEAVFLAFSFFNALQIVSYVPQIVAVARDRNGATAISYSSWAVWMGGSAMTTAYALINIWDIWLALVNGVHTVCCLAVMLLTAWKRAGLSMARDRCSNLGSVIVAEPSCQGDVSPQDGSIAISQKRSCKRIPPLSL